MIHIKKKAFKESLYFGISSILNPLALLFTCL